MSEDKDGGNRNDGNPPETRKEIPQPPPSPALNRGDRAAALAEERDIERASSEHRRDEVARRILAWGIWALMVVVFIIVIGAVFALGYHLVLPNGSHWLNDAELQDIKNFVLSGAVVGLGTTYIRRYLEGRAGPPTNN